MSVLTLHRLVIPGMKKCAFAVTPQQCATVERCWLEASRLVMPMGPPLPRENHQALTTWLAMPWPRPIGLQHLVDRRGYRWSRNRIGIGQEAAAWPRQLPHRGTCSIREELYGD